MGTNHKTTNTMNQFKIETNLIYCTSPPYYIGKIVQFRNEGQMLDWIATKKMSEGICIAGKVPGHSILVIYNGAKDKETALPDSVILFHQMALFYYNERIKNNSRRFKNYLQ